MYNTLEAHDLHATKTYLLSVSFPCRWSVMVFERDIGIASTRTPKMSISHYPDPLLSQYEDSALWHLQSIVYNEDTQIMLQSTRILCETVNDFIARVRETSSDEEQLSIKCDILR